MRLTNKNCFITGTNRGLGEVMVRKFASEGANIWAHARKQSNIFEEKLKKLSVDYEVRIEPVYFDLLDYGDMKSAIVSIMKSKIPIDVLINNAGIAHGGLFQTTPIKTIKEIYDINYFAMMELTQFIAKIMIRQKSGSIINIASIAGLDLKPGNCAYGMSKSAIISATSLLAKEFTPLGIRVNAVAPGLLSTDMAALMEEKAYDDMVGHSLMKRLGQPEEIANVVAFLASDEASFVSGQTLRVDGGNQ